TIRLAASPSTSSLRSRPAVIRRSRSADKDESSAPASASVRFDLSATSSDPALSSKISSCPPCPSGLVHVLIPLRVLALGNENGVWLIPLCKLPSTTGRSASSSMYPTSTSCPTLGRNCAPYPVPAHACATLSQADERSS